jgi:hypothetical protein
MKTAWTGEGEGGDQSVEMVTLAVDHVIASLHTAYRCVENGTAGVAEGFTGIELGLFPYDTFPADLLYFTVGVGDDPVPVHQAGTRLAVVMYGYGIGKYKAIFVGDRLRLDIMGLYLNINLVL